MTVSDKHSNLLQFVINQRCKSFIVQSLEKTIISSECLSLIVQVLSKSIISNECLRGKNGPAYFDRYRIRPGDEFVDSAVVEVSLQDLQLHQGLVLTVRVQKLFSFVISVSEKIS